MTRAVLVAVFAGAVSGCTVAHASEPQQRQPLPAGIQRFQDGPVTCYYATWPVGFAEAVALSCIVSPPVKIDYSKKVER